MPAHTSESTKANVRTKSVYEPTDPADGRRVLVTQYWPRGVRRDSVDEYVRALAPSRELLQSYRAGLLGWDALRQQYLEQMGTPEAQHEIRRLARQALAQPVTLLCACKDATRCHRALLQGLVAHEATSAP